MSTFTDAQGIYDVLEGLGLLDSQGLAIDSDPTLDCAQGVAHGFSSFSDDEIDLYSIDIEVFSGIPREVVWRNARARHEADAESLVCIAGHTWELVLRQLQPDAEVPSNITSLILDALGEGHVLDERNFPEPRWFESQYKTTSAIADRLKQAGIPFGVIHTVEIKKWGTADSYIQECVDTGEFAFAVMLHPTRAGADASLRIHLFIEEHWASDNPSWFGAYFPIEAPHTFVSGDGWIVRVVLDELGSATQEDLLDGAQAIQEVVGGLVMTQAGEAATPAPPVTDADASALGPQENELIALFNRLETVTIHEANGFDSEPFLSENRAREQSRRRASVLASESDRELPWHLIMNVTGPNAPAPAWFVSARVESTPDATVLRAAFNLLFSAQCTADALLLRDLVGVGGGFSQADYDLLTRPWRSVVGPIHPDDPYLPQAWGARRTPDRGI